MPQDLFDRLFRTTVGFDQLADFVGHIDIGTYPPYNIEKVVDHPIYAITIAVAGFLRDELDVSMKDSILTVKGSKKHEDVKTQFIHQGLAFRDFKREFRLEQGVQVTNVSLSNGLLVVMIQKNEPEDNTQKFDIK
jgi:molecular chaperone IbpA